MDTMLPSSRLLPITIVAISAALVLKGISLVVLAPSPSAFWLQTTQALVAARSTASQSVIASARAAGIVPKAPTASPGQPTGGQADVAPASKPVSPATLPPSAAPQTPPVEASSAAMDIDLHQSQIDERELKLTEREATTAAVEKHLTERVSELLVIQSQLQTLETTLKDQNEVKWAGLVKLYEGMRPRDAASIFNGLDKPTLLEIVDRMKPAKAAPVVAMMEPENARQVTSSLANRRGQATPTGQN